MGAGAGAGCGLAGTGGAGAGFGLTGAGGTGAGFGLTGAGGAGAGFGLTGAGGAGAGFGLTGAGGAGVDFGLTGAGGAGVDFGLDPAGVFGFGTLDAMVPEVDLFVDPATGIAGLINMASRDSWAAELDLITLLKRRCLRTPSQETYIDVVYSCFLSIFIHRQHSSKPLEKAGQTIRQVIPSPSSKRSPNCAEAPRLCVLTVVFVSLPRSQPGDTCRAVHRRWLCRFQCRTSLPKITEPLGAAVANLKLTADSCLIRLADRARSARVMKGRISYQPDLLRLLQLLEVHIRRDVWSAPSANMILRNNAGP